ncbi:MULTISPECIES: twin-arginine translocase TatA/TatE family subunit [Chryseobacterium]|uniref:Sec-independent protein translocase protein TatA n=1 Tax=Chryseobacterium camelliae TaxID=1265445 RepID=A0ABU0TQV4_9FLAO|nr:MULTISPECIES: twin-arginine translocase TatA/TatE family subunit [Chryseobacterium]MDQ1098705.1 sec-independent protein translocase protein TatA [Chryseobacterium camelliae]MDR6086061.1 sec-independent protein translocase protein TatA [Chryseobacterium sp. SORGH_AS_0909]MDR6130429.1 sec-independent protein translocase protein TatA [Chryseobacterium sp. SORGH_AS_1175]MDT3407444.1 sec-independent protein translocase protein TatA [Pseudacidovorax intermedius]
MNTLTMLSLSWQHILIVVLILVLLFGGKKIPELMRGVGSGIKEFKDAVKEEDKPASDKTSSTNNNSSSTPTN